MDELTRLSDPGATKGRVILAHRGNGASLAAVHNGKSIVTSMCFTPTTGLVMSTRSGDPDPGLAPYLARTEQMTTSQFYKMVNHESGLLGVSETSSAMRDLLEHEEKDVRAAEAVALYCYELFVDRGSTPGCELLDWLQAEGELKLPAQASNQSLNKTVTQEKNASSIRKSHTWGKHPIGTANRYVIVTL